MSSKIKCAIFDLDGTLVNTIDDLGIACDILIKKYGFDAKWTKDDYKRFVGSGAKKLVSRAFNNTLDDTTLVDRYNEFKKIYNDIKLDNAHAYDGIVEQLDILKNNGIKLAVVTNKPDESAKGMVEHIFGENYFDVIIGCVDGVPTKPDPATTNMALEQMNCSSKEAIYFGDSEIDMQTAQNANVEAVGCSWGYRSFETLFKENPSIIIDEPKYISKLF
jgi:phosphoglycolate phosphatase